MLYFGMASIGLLLGFRLSPSHGVILANGTPYNRHSLLRK